MISQSHRSLGPGDAVQLAALAFFNMCFVDDAAVFELDTYGRAQASSRAYDWCLFQALGRSLNLKKLPAVSRRHAGFQPHVLGHHVPPRPCGRRSSLRVGRAHSLEEGEGGGDGAAAVRTDCPVCVRCAWSITNASPAMCSGGQFARHLSAASSGRSMRCRPRATRSGWPLLDRRRRSR